jgi:O-acetyl-ADP-ribose deacetylase (regulator of RNase III)
MSTITIQKISITKLHADAIVNAANDMCFLQGEPVHEN